MWILKCLNDEGFVDKKQKRTEPTVLIYLLSSRHNTRGRASRLFAKGGEGKGNAFWYLPEEVHYEPKFDSISYRDYLSSSPLLWTFTERF